MSFFAIIKSYYRKELAEFFKVKSICDVTFFWIGCAWYKHIGYEIFEQMKWNHFLNFYSAVIVASDKPWAVSHDDLIVTKDGSKFTIDLSSVETSLNAVDTTIVYWNAPNEYIGNQV